MRLVHPNGVNALRAAALEDGSAILAVVRIAGNSGN
jgi:hypothetical protein